MDQGLDSARNGAHYIASTDADGHVCSPGLAVVDRRNSQTYRWYGDKAPKLGCQAQTRETETIKPYQLRREHQ